MTTTETLAIRERDPLDLAPRMVVSLDVLRAQLNELEAFKRDIMREGVDYGVIPGTPKPTLLKPGAEKLALVFGLAPTFVTTDKVEDWEAGRFHYEVECRLTSKRSGDVVAGASGSANTLEPRYRWRKGERLCPNCGRPAIIKGKADYGGGWLCFAKKGGCGSKFETGDSAIEGQVTGNTANPEPYELVNTVLKMAQKRALVAAVLLAVGGSGHFTQDVEDLPSEAGETVVIEGTARPAPVAPARPASRQAPAAAPARGPRQEAPKPTETPCDVCGRMVESEALLKDSLAKFKLPFCTQHMNEALDGLKPETAAV